MSDQASTTSPAATLREALVSLHKEVAELAHHPDLDAELVATAADALKQLRLAAALAADSSADLGQRLSTLRGELCELLEEHDSNSLKQRALQRAAAFVSGAICELRPSLLG